MVLKMHKKRNASPVKVGHKKSKRSLKWEEELHSRFKQ